MTHFPRDIFCKTQYSVRTRTLTGQQGAEHSQHPGDPPRSSVAPPTSLVPPTEPLATINLLFVTVSIILTFQQCYKEENGVVCNLFGLAFFSLGISQDFRQVLHVWAVCPFSFGRCPVARLHPRCLRSPAEGRLGISCCELSCRARSRTGACGT